VERREAGRGAGVHAPQAEFTFRTYCRQYGSNPRPVSTSVTVQKELWEVTNDGSGWMVGNSEVVVGPDLPAPHLAVQSTDISTGLSQNKGSLQMAARGGFDFRNDGKCFRMSATPTVGV